MGYIIPAGYARVNLEYAARSSMGSQIVTGLGVSDPPTEGLLDAIEDWWNDSLKLRTLSNYTLLNIEARSDVEVLERTIGAPGALVDAPAPPNTAALVKFGSGLVGRANRGRMYLPGVLTDDDVQSDGSIEVGAIASIQGVVNDLMGALVTAGTGPVILHSAVGTPTLVTSADVQPVAATQRRRLRR